MLLLVLGDLLEPVADPVGVPGLGEVLLRELSEVGGVEVVLEVLEREGVLEYLADGVS